MAAWVECADCRGVTSSRVIRASARHPRPPPSPSTVPGVGATDRPTSCYPQFAPPPTCPGEAAAAIGVPQITARHYRRGTAHGRRETRVARTLAVTDLGLDFPYVAQAAKTTRYRTDRKTGKLSRQTVYALADLTHQQASPQRIGEQCPSSHSSVPPQSTGSAVTTSCPSPACTDPTSTACPWAAPWSRGSASRE